MSGFINLTFSISFILTSWYLSEFIDFTQFILKDYCISITAGLRTEFIDRKVTDYSSWWKLSSEFTEPMKLVVRYYFIFLLIICLIDTNPIINI